MLFLYLASEWRQNGRTVPAGLSGMLIFRTKRGILIKFRKMILHSYLSEFNFGPYWSNKIPGLL